MDETTTRLQRCFLAMFPELDSAGETIHHASADTVPRWDSLAQVTLLSLIGEEFGIGIDFEAFEGAWSFSAILDRLRSCLASS
jgi:acyl carrier protein